MNKALVDGVRIPTNYQEGDDTIMIRGEVRIVVKYGWTGFGGCWLIKTKAAEGEDGHGKPTKEDKPRRGRRNRAKRNNVSEVSEQDVRKQDASPTGKVHSNEKMS